MCATISHLWSFVLILCLKTGDVSKQSMKESNLCVLRKIGSTAQAGPTHRSKQLIVPGSNAWRVWWAVYHFPFKRFQHLLKLCETYDGILPCCKIPLSCLSLNCRGLAFNAWLKGMHSVRSKHAVICLIQVLQLIVQYAKPVPANAKHDLGEVNIRFGGRRGCMPGIFPWQFSLGAIVIDLFLQPRNNGTRDSLL